LEAEVQAFERALEQHEARRSDRTSARAGMAAAMASGLAAVRTLDVIVGNTLRGDPRVMAVWARDR
jgi:hypothetical protein